MLILSRRPNEGFTVGDDIEIYVLRIQGNRVKLGINAPRETLILRKELQRDKS